MISFTMNSYNSVFTDVKLDISGLLVKISNGFLSLSFNKEASLSSLKIYGKSIIENLYGKKTFYLDWNGGKFIFIPEGVSLVNYSHDYVHIFYYQYIFKKFKIELHYIVRKFTSGLYSYVNIINNGSESYKFSELRLVYRFDPKLMNRLNNQLIDMKSYSYVFLKNSSLIQDETWQLNDGSYYSKYDLAGFVRDIEYYGVYGNGYGAWLINSTCEYYSGGPLKQDLLVHQDSLMLNYLTSTHFGTPELVIPPFFGSKMYGPWLIYFNLGKNCDILSNVNSFIQNEKLNFPYTWLKDTNFPIKRSYLKGKINSFNRYKIVIFSSIQEKFDTQTLGYLYYTDTVYDGSFSIKNIRPNIYMMNIYPISGYDCNFKWEKIIDLNNNYDIGNIDIKDSIKDTIWSIGETNRKSINSRFNLENRNYVWHTLVPKNLDFYIGKSNLLENWFYSQSKKGTWRIHFFDIFDNVDRILNIGVSGASSNIIDHTSKIYLEIYLNDFLLKKCFYDNDKSIYRGALDSGNYHSEKILIPYDNVLTGLNILSLNLINGSLIYDCINLCYQNIIV